MLQSESWNDDLLTKNYDGRNQDSFEPTIRTSKRKGGKNTNKNVLDEAFCCCSGVRVEMDTEKFGNIPMDKFQQNGRYSYFEGAAHKSSHMVCK